MEPSASDKTAFTPQNPARPADPFTALKVDVLAYIKANPDGGKGAPWEDIVAYFVNAKKQKESDVEEAVNKLLDEGRIYEPILGRLVAL